MSLPSTDNSKPTELVIKDGGDHILSQTNIYDMVQMMIDYKVYPEMDLSTIKIDMIVGDELVHIRKPDWIK